ncbi:Sir2 family NAD-dependent protein deacetylase [Paraburkholderia strydomiana]|uniref:Sir2 family NAD-dependent protein deacetylase n=1 Tax=Paraburkholderia strydomiana TaxID=1245417 RepID=UPI0038BA7589
MPPGLCAALARARRDTVLTGACVSAESGLPTFRNKLSGHRREQLAHTQPNSAHHATATLERIKSTCNVGTQNVDDLHERAGTSNVVDLH